MDVIVAGMTLIALVAGPLAWRVIHDRRREQALGVRAQVQAEANRVLGGESFLSIDVRPPGLMRPGQVVLDTPRDWSWLTDTVWPRVHAVVPKGYVVVAHSRPGPAGPRSADGLPRAA